MKWTKRKTKWLLAFALWLSVMPIHIWDIPVRGGGTMPFYVWNFYNHIVAFVREPVRCITEPIALGSIALYSIPSIIHIAFAIGLANLVVKLGTRRNVTEQHARQVSSEAAPSASPDEPSA